MSTLLRWLDRLPAEAPTIEDGDHTWTVGALREVVARLAGALADLPPGSRFAVHARNRAEVVAAYLAAAWTGTVLVPLNHHLSAREVRWQLDDAGVRAVFASASSVEALAPVRDDTRGWWCFDEGTGWQELPSRPPGPRVDQPPDAPRVQMYTSGTTGRPKGALLSEANLVALVRSWGDHVPLDAACRTLQVTPLFHIGAVTQALSNLRAGGVLVLLPEFSPAVVDRVLRERGVTHALLVPAMIRWILLERDRAALAGAAPRAASASFLGVGGPLQLDGPPSDGGPPDGYPSLRTLVYGAAPMPPELARRARAVFRCDWFQGYGLTETTGVLTILRPEDHGVDGRLASAGRPLSCCEIRVVDREDHELPPGEVGEVVARGANVGQGYHGAPEATAEAWRGGWFHTGDLGYRDADGYLFLVDRLKDMILVGGENVYSREVEATLEVHPAVREVAVIGVPHDVWGEAVLACVVPSELAPSDPAALERVMIRFCRDQLARYKCPTRVKVMSALPRNAAGKVLKGELREPYWAGRDRRIG